MTSVTSPSPQIAPAAPVNHEQEAPRQDAPDKPSPAQTEAATRKPDEWLEELPEVEPKIALAVRGGPRHVEPNLQVKPAGFDVTDYLRLGPSGIREKTGVPEFGDSLSSRQVDKQKAKQEGIDYQDGDTVGTIAAQQFGKVIEVDIKDGRLAADSDEAKAKKLMDAQAALDSGYDLYGYAETINTGSGTYRETSDKPTKLTGQDVKEIVDKDAVADQLSKLMAKPHIAERYRREMAFAAEKLLPDSDINGIRDKVDNALFNKDGSANTRFEENVIAQTEKANQGSPDREQLASIDAEVSNYFDALRVLRPDDYAQRRQAFNQNLSTYQLNKNIANPSGAPQDVQAMALRDTISIVKGGINGALGAMDKSDKLYDNYKKLGDQLGALSTTPMTVDDRIAIRQAISDAAESRDVNKIDELTDKALKNVSGDREKTAGTVKKILHGASSTGTLGAMSGMMGFLSGAMQIKNAGWSEMTSDQRVAAARDLVGGLSMGTDFARFGSNIIEQVSKVAGEGGVPKVKATEWLGLMDDNFSDIWGKSSSKGAAQKVNAAIADRVNAGAAELETLGPDGQRLNGAELDNYNAAAQQVGEAMGARGKPNSAVAAGRSFLRFTFGAGLDAAGGVMDIVTGVAALKRANTALEKAGAGIQIAGGSATAGMAVTSTLNMLAPKAATLAGNYAANTASQVIRGLAIGSRVLGPALGVVGAAAGFAGMLIAEAINHAKKQKLTDSQGQFFKDLAGMNATQSDWGDKLEYARYASYMYGGRDSASDESIYAYQADEWKHFQETESKRGSALARLAPYLHRDGDPESKNLWEKHLAGNTTRNGPRGTWVQTDDWRPWSSTDMTAGAPARR